MIQIPSRIEGLIRRIEAGEQVTQADVDRLATLQGLDLAKAGEDFVRDWARREAESTEEFRQRMQGA